MKKEKRKKRVYDTINFTIFFQKVNITIFFTTINVTVYDWYTIINNISGGLSESDVALITICHFNKLFKKLVKFVMFIV